MNTTVEHAACCRFHQIRCYHDLHLLRPKAKPDKAGADPDNAPQDRTSSASAEAIVCRQCLHTITSSAERRLVNGAHAHTFANPEGILFEIACYRNAWGCGYVGPSSPQFTWFAGYRWRISVCANCHTHLGWRFAALGGDFFHGLITSQILSKAF